MVRVEEENWLRIGVWNTSYLLCSIELSQVWIEKELDVESTLAEGSIEKTIQKRCCQHVVIFLKRILEVITPYEICIKFKAVHILSIE